jgi:hypothetical protein
MEYNRGILINEADIIRSLRKWKLLKDS